MASCPPQSRAGRNALSFRKQPLPEERQFVKGCPVIASPCVLVCSIDMASGYCFGCGRTREEIGNWTLFSDAERAALMQLLPARLETVERRPRRETRRARMARENGGLNAGAKREP
jgi:predicted Fe-S protein YdhL (DUF1289 family)